MSHDLWASFATTELADHFRATPSDCLATVPAAGLSVFVGGRSRASWPFEDGAIVVEHGTKKYNVAVEFKRQNEGLHGVLTALGQSLAYLNKGYHGAVVIIPKNYSSHSHPGNYVAEVVKNTVVTDAVGVFTYDEPDTANSSPFAGKLARCRKLEVDTVTPVTTRPIPGKSETQWMHVREGSSTPSAFFKYLQTAKVHTTLTHLPHVPAINAKLRNAVARIKPGVDPIRYLSYTAPRTTNLHDEVWRRFWFDYVLTRQVMNPWTVAGGRYVPDDAPTALLQADGTSPMKFFGGKSNSIKNIVCEALNNATINEDTAWELFAKKIHNRAHSFREDIDSGLEAMGLLDNDGKPTELGYRFVDACERTNSAYSGTPIAILTAALLKNGEFGALLHYIFKLSEERFRANPMDFTAAGTFDSKAYMQWIEGELFSRLRVIRKVTPRGGTSRKPLQGELTLLGKFELIAQNAQRFRTGVGLVIDWPKVQDALDFPI